MIRSSRLLILLTGLLALPSQVVAQQTTEGRDGLAAVLAHARKSLPQGLIAVGAKEEIKSVAQSVASDLNAVVKGRDEVMLCEDRSCVFVGVVGMIDVERLTATGNLVEVHFTRMTQSVNESHAWIGFEEIEASASRNDGTWVLEKFRIRRRS
jgi:hypothetical protein